MKNIKFLISFLFLIALGYSCKHKGCTDSTAYNYDANANVNDNSCKYSDGYVYVTIDTTNVTIPQNIMIDGTNYQVNPNGNTFQQGNLAKGSHNLYADNGVATWNIPFEVGPNETTQLSLNLGNASSGNTVGKLALSNNNECGTRNITFVVDGTTTLTLGDSPAQTSIPSTPVTTTLVPGNHNVTAYSQNNQAWMYNNINIRAGRVTTIYNSKKNMLPVPTGSCNITFYSTNHYNININFSSGYIGSISTCYCGFSPSSTCVDNYFCSIILPIGTYSYNAGTTSGNPKTWSGTVNATGGCVSTLLN